MRYKVRRVLPHPNDAEGDKRVDKDRDKRAIVSERLLSGSIKIQLPVFLANLVLFLLRERKVRGFIHLADTCAILVQRDYGRRDTGNYSIALIMYFRK